LFASDLHLTKKAVNPEHKERSLNRVFLQAALYQTMLFFLRHLPALQQRLALGIAIVILLLGSIGEGMHYRQHHVLEIGAIATSTHGTAQHRQDSAQDGTVSLFPYRSVASCPICAWENVLVSGPAALVLPLLLMVFIGYTHFSPQPLFSVRQTIALRESRGPPRLV
jgi:hypothetical protein